MDVLDRVGQSNAWEEARAVNRLQPFFLVGDEFAAFVRAQVGDFQEMSREIGLIP